MNLSPKTEILNKPLIEYQYMRNGNVKGIFKHNGRTYETIELNSPYEVQQRLMNFLIISQIIKS